MWTTREVMYKQETAGKDNGTGFFSVSYAFQSTRMPAVLLLSSLDIPAFRIFNTL